MAAQKAEKRLSYPAEAGKTTFFSAFLLNKSTDGYIFAGWKIKY
jgi:hypothetical protein